MLGILNKGKGKVLHEDLPGGTLIDDKQTANVSPQSQTKEKILKKEPSDVQYNHELQPKKKDSFLSAPTGELSSPPSSIESGPTNKRALQVVETAYIPVTVARKKIQDILTDWMEMKENYVNSLEDIDRYYREIESEEHARIRNFIIAYQHKYKEMKAHHKKLLQDKIEEFNNYKEWAESNIRSLTDSNNSLVAEKANVMLQEKRRLDKIIEQKEAEIEKLLAQIKKHKIDSKKEIDSIQKDIDGHLKNLKAQHEKEIKRLKTEHRLQRERIVTAQEDYISRLHSKTYELLNTNRTIQTELEEYKLRMRELHAREGGFIGVATDSIGIQVELLLPDSPKRRNRKKTKAILSEQEPTAQPGWTDYDSGGDDRQSQVLIVEQPPTPSRRLVATRSGTIVRPENFRPQTADSVTTIPMPASRGSPMTPGNPEAYTELDTLQTTVNNMSEEIQLLRSRLQAYEYPESDPQNEDSHSTLSSLVKDLQLQLNAAKEAKAEAERRAKKAIEKAEALEKRLRELQSSDSENQRHKELMARLEANEKNITELKLIVEEYKLQLSAKSTHISELQTELQNLQKANLTDANVRERLALLTNQVNALKQERDDNKARMFRTKATIESLQADIEALRRMKATPAVLNAVTVQKPEKDKRETTVSVAVKISKINIEVLDNVTREYVLELARELDTVEQERDRVKQELDDTRERFMLASDCEKKLRREVKEALEKISIAQQKEVALIQNAKANKVFADTFSELVEKTKALKQAQKANKGESTESLNQEIQQLKQNLRKYRRERDESEAKVTEVFRSHNEPANQSEAKKAQPVNFDELLSEDEAALKYEGILLSNKIEIHSLETTLKEMEQQRAEAISAQREAIAELDRYRSKMAFDAADFNALDLIDQQRTIESLTEENRKLKETNRLDGKMNTRMKLIEEEILKWKSKAEELLPFKHECQQRQQHEKELVEALEAQKRQLQEWQASQSHLNEIQQRALAIKQQYDELKSLTESQILSLDKEVSHQMEELESKQKELLELQEEAIAAHAEIDQLLSKNELLSSELSDVKDALNASKVQISEMEESLLNMKEHGDKIIKKLEAMDSISSELTDAKGKLEETEEALRDERKERTRIEMLLKEEQRLRRSLFNQLEDMKGKIRVYCRCRPMSKTETENKNECAISFPDETTIRVVPKNREFVYNRVFDPMSTQEDVFEDTKHLVQSAIDGYNVCIFAYGQTGSGKTFTMAGTPQNEGITPRAMRELYRLVEKHKNAYDIQITSYMLELYLDELYDLFLDKTAEKLPLSIKKDPKGIVFVQNATIKEAATLDEINEHFRMGEQNRHTRTTAMNEASSRSHLVFSVIVRTTQKLTGEVAYGKLSLVDLAGSERIKKTKITSAEGQAEGLSINRSLTALGDVISALSSGQSFIPYRNNKLTMLMSDSLGGTAKTLMFVNVSPADYNVDETMTSLMYASRVKMITNATAKNVESKEIARLRSIIQSLHKGIVTPGIESEIGEDISDTLTSPTTIPKSPRITVESENSTAAGERSGSGGGTNGDENSLNASNTLQLPTTPTKPLSAGGRKSANKPQRGARK